MPRHPRVMGPGQGILPLSPDAATGSASFGTIGTGARGIGPSPEPGVGPFDQTATDFTNLFQYGTTAPHWSQNQMRKMYNVSLRQALFSRDQTRNAITSAEVDRIYRNIGGGMGHYAGQMLDMFGGLGPNFGAAPAAPAPNNMPGSQPGMLPGYQPGMLPGFQPVLPGFQPGMYPGMPGPSGPPTQNPQLNTTHLSRLRHDMRRMMTPPQGSGTPGGM